MKNRQRLFYLLIVGIAFGVFVFRTKENKRHRAHEREHEAERKEVAQGPGLREEGISETVKRLEVACGCEVEVRFGEEQRLVVEAEPELLGKIRTRVDDGTLTISLEGWHLDYEPFTVRLTLRSLEKIQVSGATEMKVEGPFESASLSVQASGASNLDISDAKAEQFILHADGASEIRISGSGSSAEMHTSGASDLKAGDLQLADVKVEASGASEAEVHASRSLEAEASGASSVRYDGAPAQVKTNASGASSVEAD